MVATYDVRGRLSGELEGVYSDLEGAVKYAQLLAKEFSEAFEIWRNDGPTYTLAATIHP